jgi:protein-tyrosine phosphatase
MIDLHSHILPGIDDGAKDMDMALEMARMAVADGIEVMACTPHFMPGMYDNTASDIRQRVLSFNTELIRNSIDLAVVTGSDAHMRPDFISCLRNGDILTLHDTRYVLFEPPHNIMPQRLEDLLFNISVSGYCPIFTHPERLKWIEQNYGIVQQLSKAGVWMQITSGSLTGRFGARPQYWAKRMLAEGLVNILATDAHNTKSRPPLLAEGHAVAVSELGVDEAYNLVVTRPECVLENYPPEQAPPLLAAAPTREEGRSVFRRILEVFT